MLIQFRKLALTLLAAFLYIAPAQAQDVVLTLTDQQGGATEYTLEALEELPATTFTTSTIWTEGTPEFTGVSLMRLLSDAGISEGTLTATAANDYSVKVPVSDAVEGGPIIAYEVDGKKMSLRDKGPLWVVYPYDSNKAYQAETIYSRSIWQLRSLTAAP